MAEAPPPVGQQSLGDAMEQLRVQEEVHNMDPNSPEPDDNGGGRKRQYLIVMRHGQRADEVHTYRPVHLAGKRDEQHTDATRAGVPAV